MILLAIHPSLLFVFLVFESNFRTRFADHLFKVSSSAATRLSSCRNLSQVKRSLLSGNISDRLRGSASRKFPERVPTFIPESISGRLADIGQLIWLRTASHCPEPKETRGAPAKLIASVWTRYGRLCRPSQLIPLTRHSGVPTIAVPEKNEPCLSYVIAQTRATFPSGLGFASLRGELGCKMLRLGCYLRVS